MKTLSISLVAFLLLCISCNKKDTTTPANSGSTEDLTIRQTKIAILTSHPWMYQKLVHFYNPSTDSGKVMYERGSNNNIYPYDSYRFYYYKNGNYDEVDIYGNHFSGKWQFAAGTNDVVKITYNNNPSSVYNNIKLLNKSHYNYTYHVYTTRYAELIPVAN